ncbi:hypothetical protein ACFLZW_05455 [Chloroflexota bacterium]
MHAPIASYSPVRTDSQLKKSQNNRVIWDTSSFTEVCAQHGIAEAKASQIKAAIELGRRLTVEAPEERPAIHSPEDAAALVQYEMSALEQEELWVFRRVSEEPTRLKTR